MKNKKSSKLVNSLISNVKDLLARTSKYNVLFKEIGLHHFVYQLDWTCEKNPQFFYNNFDVIKNIFNENQISSNKLTRVNNILNNDDLLNDLKIIIDNNKELFESTNTVQDYLFCMLGTHNMFSRLDLHSDSLNIKEYFKKRWNQNDIKEIVENSTDKCEDVVNFYKTAQVQQSQLKSSFLC